MSGSSRVVLFPVDDSDDSQRSFDWLVANFFKDTDEVMIRFASLGDIAFSCGFRYDLASSATGSHGRLGLLLSTWVRQHQS